MREPALDLDKIEDFKPGAGKLDAYLFGAGTRDLGEVGAGIEYGHRISESWSALAGAQAGYKYGDESGLGYSMRAAIRGVW